MVITGEGKVFTFVDNGTIIAQVILYGDVGEGIEAVQNILQGLESV